MSGIAKTRACCTKVDLLVTQGTAASHHVHCPRKALALLFMLLKLDTAMKHS